MSKVFKVLFCGTPEFAVPTLKKISLSKNYKLVGIVTQPDRPAGRGKKLQASPVKLEALNLGVPVFNPESAKDLNFLNEIEKLKADVCIVIAYGQILSRNFLKIFPQKCVNIHGSLLPRWRGAAPIQRAIMAGDKETGVSLQIVVSKLDAGDLIAEKKINLTLDDDAISVYSKLSFLGSEFIDQELYNYLIGKTTPIPQDESLVTHAAKISNEEARINWSENARDLHNKVRGISAGPIATTSFQGKILKIHKTKILEQKTNIPGTICEIKKTSFAISCGQDAIEILEIQPESKPKMSAEAFLLGHKLKIGDKFE